MCGVFGFISLKERNSASVVYAMSALQHRGHDAWGVSFLGQETMESFRQTGVIDGGSLTPFITNFAICHNRYQTSGTGGTHEIQPFSDAHVSLAHNGQITNLDSSFMGSDSLQLYNYLKLKRIISLDFFEHFLGSYSIVAKDSLGLVGLRDPYGLRPLFMGQNLQMAAFASEKGALLRFGFLHAEIEEVPRGSIIHVSKDLDRINVTRQFLSEDKLPLAAPCFFESVYFSSVQSSFNQKSIIDSREGLGLLLAEQLKEDKKNDWIHSIDYVIPIPDTSIPASIVLAEALHLPYRQYIVKNAKSLRTFITHNGREKSREKSIEEKYSFMKDKLRNKNLLLVDDSIVRGSTLKSINSFLRSMEVQSIRVASTCPKIFHPCAYGINFPSCEELIANQYPIHQQLEASLFTDSIHFLELERLKKFLGPSYCYACVDNRYPIPINNDFFQQRIKENHCGPVF